MRSKLARSACSLPVTGGSSFGSADAMGSRTARPAPSATAQRARRSEGIGVSHSGASEALAEVVKAGAADGEFDGAFQLREVAFTTDLDGDLIRHRTKARLKDGDDAS